MRSHSCINTMSDQRSLGGPGTLGVVTMVTVPWGMVQWQHGTFIIN